MQYVNLRMKTYAILVEIQTKIKNDKMKQTNWPTVQTPTQESTTQPAAQPLSPFQPPLKSPVGKKKSLAAKKKSPAVKIQPMMQNPVLIADFTPMQLPIQAMSSQTQNPIS